MSFPNVKIPPPPPMPPPKRTTNHGCFISNKMCMISGYDFTIPNKSVKICEVKCRGCGSIQIIKDETKQCEYCDTELVRYM